MRAEIIIYLCCRYVVKGTGLRGLWAVDTNGALQSDLLKKVALVKGVEETGWDIQ